MPDPVRPNTIYICGSGAGAPDNTCWSVDYVPALHTARFSTFGRGLWNYDLGGGDPVFRDGLK